MIDPLSDLIESIVGLRATQYAYVACTAIWAYDYFLTLDREITLVWQSQWSLGKVMYFLNRYNPIIVFIPINYFFHDVQALNCQNVLIAGIWFYVIGFMWSNTILSMRVWAIWGGNRNILIFLVVLIMVYLIVLSVFTQRTLDSITYSLVPESLVPAFGLACAPIPRKHVVWPEFVAIMIYDTIVGALALTKGFEQYRSSRTPLIVTMFYDGLVYYIYTLLLATAIVIVALIAPVQWIFLLLLPYAILASIFSTRILLNIRGNFVKTADPTLSDISTVLRFQRPGASPRPPGPSQFGFDYHETGFEFESQFQVGGDSEQL